MGVGGQSHAPVALPPENTRYPLYRRLSVPQGPFGRVWKILPPTGFDPRTVQLVASRYTDYARPRYLSIFRKSVGKMQVSLNSDQEWRVPHMKTNTHIFR